MTPLRHVGRLAPTPADWPTPPGWARLRRGPLELAVERDPPAGDGPLWLLPPGSPRPGDPRVAAAPAEELSILLGDGPAGLVDPATGRLLLVADPCGRRPLYFAETPTGLAWGTDLLAVVAAAGARRLHPPALLDSLLTDQSLAGETLYDGVRLLPADAVLDYRLETGRLILAARPARPVATGSLRELLGAALAGQEDAVCLLSGGLDSALLAALKPGGRALTGTFDPLVPAADFAATAAARCDLTRELVRFSPRLVDLWARLVEWTGLPQPDLGAAAVTVLLAAAAANGWRRAVSGLGADELFGGRRPWRPPGRWALRGLGPPRLTEADARRLYGFVPPDWPALELRFHLRRQLLTPELAATLGEALEAPPRAPAPAEALRRLSPAQARLFWELRGRLAGRLGPTLAAAETATGVTVATPYLTREVLQWAVAHGDRVRYGRLDKPALRAAARGLVPDDIVGRPKLPRRRPDIPWLLAEPLPDPVAEALAPRALGQLGLFDPVTVHHWLRLVRARPRAPLNLLRARLLLIAASVQRLWLPR